MNLRTAISMSLFAALVLAACAMNPVTHQPELSTMSPEREAALGSEAATMVEERIGLVEDPKLAAYIEAIGQRLAAQSPRRDISYHFAVADMEVPNAFALPGGWIYVSRGLLTITNSETELANVIGHEIGHVAARHAASREARSIGAGLLSIIGSVVSTATLGADLGMGQLFQIAGAGLIASYSRDQERQADDIGQTLAAASGWNPGGMPQFLATLDDDTRLTTEDTQTPGFLSSHPVTAERIRNTRARAMTLDTAPAPPIAPNREAFLARLDGLLVGPDPKQGVFRGGRFLHPGMRFAIDFPPDWVTQNGDTVVGATAPDGNGLIVLQAQQPGDDPLAAAERFADAHRIALSDTRELSIAGHRAFRAVAVASTSDGPLGLDLCWIAYRDLVLRFTGMASADRFARFAPAFLQVGQSFANLSKGELATIHDLRLRIVRAQAGETVAELSRRTGNSMPLDHTSVVNGLEPGASLAAGAAVKIAVKQRYIPH